MSLPKHLRPRWRYLAVAIETWTGTDLSRRDFQAAVWSAGRSLLGDPGSADVDLTVVQFRYATESGVGRALVRVRRGERDRGRAAVACVDGVAGTPVAVWVLGVGGTVRACEEKYMGDPPEATDTDVVFQDSRRPATVREDAVDLRDGDTFTGATPLDMEGD